MVLVVVFIKQIFMLLPLGLSQDSLCFPCQFAVLKICALIFIILQIIPVLFGWKRRNYHISRHLRSHHHIHHLGVAHHPVLVGRLHHGVEGHLAHHIWLHHAHRIWNVWVHHWNHSWLHWLVHHWHHVLELAHHRVLERLRHSHGSHHLRKLILLRHLHVEGLKLRHISHHVWLLRHWIFVVHHRSCQRSWFWLCWLVYHHTILHRWQLCHYWVHGRQIWRFLRLIFLFLTNLYRI